MTRERHSPPRPASRPPASLTRALAAAVLTAGALPSCSTEREPAEPAARTATAPAERPPKPRAGARIRAAHEPTRSTVRGHLRFDRAAAPTRDELLGVLAEALHYGGPTILSGEEFHERLTAAGARLDVSADEGAVRFDFEAPPEALAQVLEAAGQLARHPHYPPEVVELARGRALVQADARAHDPAAVADARLAALAYGPAGPGTSTDFAALEAADYDALLARHRALIAPEHLWAAALGPLEAGELELAIERELGGPAWKDRAADSAAIPGAPTPEPGSVPATRPLDSVRAPRLAALVLPEAGTVELRLVAPGVPVTSPDYPALRIWSDLNGPRPGGGAFFAARWPLPNEGAKAPSGELFGFVAGARDTAEGLARFAELLDHLAEPASLPADPEAFEAARRRVLASQAAEASAPLALLEPDLHGVERDFQDRHRAALLAATPESVAAAAERALAPFRAGRWLATAVLPAAPDEALASLRARGISVEAGDARPALRGTPEAVGVLERVLARLGGREGWRRLEHLTLVGEVVFDGAEAPVAVTIARDLARGLLRVEHREAGGARIQIATPERAATLAPGGGAATELDAELHGRVLERERTLVYSVLRGLARGTLHAVRLADDLADDRGLLVTYRGRELGTLRLEGDLPVALEVRATRAEPPRTIELADWRPHGAAGLLFAGTMRDEGRRFRWLRVDPDRAPAEDAFRIE